MTPLHDVALASRDALAACAVLGACVLLAACGSVAAPSGGGAGSSSAGSKTPVVSTSAGATPAAAATSAVPASPAAAGTAKISLDITFAATSSSPARDYTLFCEPTGGTTPDPAAACAKLLAGDDIFAPRPVRVMCPMIKVVSGRATVTGTYFGTPEHMTIMAGGCDLARWTELKAIFG
jgi:Subtilisin inhibitor-like